MKYEYNQIYISFKEALNHTAELNEMGNNGWELVVAVKVDEHNIMYLFKRPKNEKNILN